VVDVVLEVDVEVEVEVGAATRTARRAWLSSCTTEAVTAPTSTTAIAAAIHRTRFTPPEWTRSGVESRQWPR
jgi:hypothetical protein